MTSHVNPNAKSQQAAETALLLSALLINDLNVALTLGGSVSAQLVAAKSSQPTLIFAMGSAVPWGVEPGATNQAAFDSDAGKVEPPAYVGAGGTPAVLLGQPGSIVAEGTSGTYDPSFLGTPVHSGF